MQQRFKALSDFIFEIANILRGPYRPPQYRKVMLPMTVLRRLDLVTAADKEKVVAAREQLEALKLEGDGLEASLQAKIGKNLYNSSPYTFETLIGDPDNIAPNLVSFINGFSPKAREVFEYFNFEAEIEKLDNSNRLFKVVKAFVGENVDLHPDKVSGIDMGYIFEDLVRRFNEQANEEAGDHFTPREVIKLMAHLIYTGDEDIYTPGIVKKIYDPTCGTGGMLSVSEEYIRGPEGQNRAANLELYGQEYNEESWAICCSDMLIKGEPVENIAFGDTLGDGKTFDGHPHEKFHYMMANPPFGVEWKNQEDIVKKEYEDAGFKGRFGPGLPRINDGATLFLLHMISKMYPSPEEGGEGSKIAVVFNGSPLFNGEPGPSESNIRRWIIEQDMLDAIIALPDQMFYNTGISTYIWLVTNRKPAERRSKVQLVDATRHYVRMAKGLGSKRNKIGDPAIPGEPDQIGEIVRLYASYQDGATSKVMIDGEEVERVCSKIFDNRDFGFLKVVVERPLRLKFKVTADGLVKLQQETAFKNLAVSKKRKDLQAAAKEIEAGVARQARILKAIETMDADHIYMNRADWEGDLRAALLQQGEKLDGPIKKAIQSAFSVRDKNAAICLTPKGVIEPDTELRDHELIPLPADIPLPLDIGYEKDADNTKLVAQVRDHCEAYLAREVLPYVDDAWIDYSKTKVGYEIPINRHFYVYKPPRPLAEIEADIKKLESEIMTMLGGVVS